MLRHTHSEVRKYCVATYFSPLREAAVADSNFPVLVNSYARTYNEEMRLSQAAPSSEHRQLNVHTYALMAAKMPNGYTYVSGGQVPITYLQFQKQLDFVQLT